MTTNQLPQITLAALASINSAAFSETANLNQAREAAKLVLDSYELSSGEFVNKFWQPNGALFNKLSKMGVNHAQAFVEALHFIAYNELKRHTKETKRAAACIYWRLVEAAEKHAADEQAAHDVEMAAIAQHPTIAPVVAACAKSRELITELNTCDKVRFFEIYSEITAAGKLSKLTPYFSMDFQTQEIFNTKKSTDALVTYNNFVKSGFVDAYILTHLFTAVRNAAQRLDLIVETSLYIAGQHQYNESEKTTGYKLLRLFGEHTIGWVLDEPTNEPTAITKHPILVELDECLNAQVAAAHTVAIANNGSEFANVENAAAKAGVSLGDYFSFYGDAGWELDFEPMQLEQLQDIYAAAKERDGDDDDKNSADELAEQFAKFVYDKANAKNNEFLGLVSEYPAVVTDYTLKNVCPQFGFELSIGLLRKNANAKVFTLSCNHPNLINGFECLTEVGYHLLSDFHNFFYISRYFFHDILRKIE